jgi:hypothetical protein
MAVGLLRLILKTCCSEGQRRAAGNFPVLHPARGQNRDAPFDLFALVHLHVDLSKNFLIRLTKLLRPIGARSD